MSKRKLGWILVRAVLFFSGISLLGYVVYRYAYSGSPPQVGTVYGTVFSASILLAVLGMVLAFRPGLFREADGAAGLGLRGGVLLFGATWMATGLQCVRSLSQGVLESPLTGSLNFLHMISDHVMLPVGVGLFVAVPATLQAWAGEDEPEAALGEAGRGDAVEG